MKRNVALLLVVLSAAAIAASWSGSFRFSPNSVTLTDASRDGRDFQLVQPVKGQSPAGLTTLVTAEPGQPLLPQWSFTLAIPQGMRVAGVDCQASENKEMGRGLQVFPGQTPATFAQTALPAFVAPDPAVYGSDAAWPGTYAAVSPIGVKSGFRLVTVTLSPLQYQPASGRLTIAGELAVTVRYEPDPQARREFLTSGQLSSFGSAVRTLVYNPGDVSKYAPGVSRTDFGDVDYVIITSDALSASFQPLADWRTRKGFKTEIVTVAWISTNYSGRDAQEKIRNFIIDYYNTKGLRWVLLGGDDAVVPCRRARAVCAGNTGNIPADLYYADIQGTWDNDNDNIFGEANHDTVDFYYDLYIGRASVDNTTQVQTFVNKVLTHEKTPPTAYLRKMLMADALLWTGYDHTQSNDSIEAITPAGWTDRMIHSPGASTSVRDSVNNGFQFVHLVGHGDEYGTYDGSNAFYNTDFANSQTNGDKVNFLNANSCYTGNFEYSDCVAEAAHNRAGGGSIAVIYNSRYGWGTPPNIGPSEILDVRFYDYFFNHDTMPIAVTNALSKEVYRNVAISQGVWRWCYYETNLLGDPLLLMYENVPGQLSAAFTEPIGTGSQAFTVTVTAASVPVAGALVCLVKGTEVYARDYTNTSGQVSLSISPTTAGYMYVTATRANYLPDEDTCEVTLSSSGDVGVLSIVAPSGTVDSGTVVTPQAWVVNYGSSVASFPVTMSIGLDYTDSADVSGLSPDESLLVSFADWTAVQRGNQAVRCSTGLADDVDTGNDTLSGLVTVRVWDVGVVGINRPDGRYGPGDVIIPAATIRNYGTATADLEAWLLINGPTGAPYYSESTNVLGLAGGSNLLVEAFPACTLRLLGNWTVKCSTAMATDMHPENDVVTGWFETRSEWVEMEPMPLANSGKTVNDGAWLVYNSANGFIYAAKGNKSFDFYSYDMTTNRWKSLRDIPKGLEFKLPRRGACGATDGSRYIYMAKGNNTLGFWRYDVATDSWLQLVNIPPGSHRKVRAGGAAVYAPTNDTGYVYLLKGGCAEFYRYNVVTWKWETMLPAPVGASRKWNGGAFLTYDGDHTIYAHKPKYHELWAFNTLTGTWSGTRLAGMPVVGASQRSRKSRDGAAGTWFDGGVYALKGGNSSEFWRYDAAGDTWLEFDSLPHLGTSGRARRVNAGGSIVNAGGRLFALKGKKTREFWRYAIGIESDAVHSEPAREGVMAAPTTIGGRLTIGPSPLVGGMIHLAAEGTSLPGSATVRLYDAVGRPVGVWKPLLRNGTADLDVRHLAAGVYLVRAEAGGCTATQKLVIER